MKELRITHAAGTCPVRIGAGLATLAGTFNAVAARRALVVTDDVVAPLWLERVCAAVPHAEALVLPSGESHKTLATVSTIWNRLAHDQFGRDAVLIALGGGVIGDMTGFAAACWMRGVDFVQVPTTLLAQVDASVGGKTGVDLPAGKNLVGAFHQPLAVVIDTAMLDTLPDRQLSAGFAEVAKTALVAESGLLEFLERNAEALINRDGELLENVIAHCCETKARIVAADEHERGMRALLNLGHTFGHALETLTGYDRLLHGEAVAIGLVLACRLSERVLGLDAALRPRLVRLLETFGLPTSVPGDLAPDDILEAMRLDKKHHRGGWRLVLLASPGHAVVHEFRDPGPVREVLAAR